MDMLRKTPLHAAHLELRARMVDFAGWEMPVQYTSILDESRAVRTASGIFDISHMGRAHLSGEGATALLQSLTTNDVAALKPSEAHYSLLTNSQGGIMDDIIVYREGEEAYLVVVNASNTQKDLDWIRLHTPTSVTMEERTEATAMIAAQGPDAPALVAKLAENPALLELDRFQFAAGRIADTEAIFCRTGYTGEDGFEIILPAENAVAVWNALREGGALPCGLGARDALRIEAGYPLYGHEIDETISPVEAGLMWVVKLEKGEFTGKEAIAEAKKRGPQRRLVGLMSLERIVPRQGYTIYANDELVGEITSGIFSPTLNHGLAMGYIILPYAKTGTSVEIDIRNRRAFATVIPKKGMLDI